MNNRRIASSLGLLGVLFLACAGQFQLTISTDVRGFATILILGAILTAIILWFVIAGNGPKG